MNGIYVLPKAKVKNLMTKKVVTVNAEDTIETLIKKFRRYKYHGFPVLDEKNELTGMVTKTDVIRTLARKKLSDLFASHVKDIMAPAPQSVDPDTNVTDAVAMLIGGSFRSLPVVENKKLIGLVSYSDIVKHVLKGPRSVE